MTTQPDDMAFPIANEFVTSSGLTKREYFAGLALQGIINETDLKYDPIHIVRYAVKASDALISALNED